MRANETNAYPADNAQPGSLRDFYTVIFRHKWKSLLFFVVVKLDRCVRIIDHA